MRIKPLVVLLLVCSLSQAADTVASLGDSIKATQFVSAVDHTRLVNGTTEVIANADGTASISTAQSVQKPNCVRISQADGSTGKTIVLSFRQTSDELESWGSAWPDQLEFTIEYDGVSYDAITVGETLTDGREVSTSLAWMNGSIIYPAGIYSSTSWSGVLYEFESPGGLDLIGDGNGESCSTYTYTSSTGTSAIIATVPFVDGHKWDWTEVTNKPSIPAAQVNADWNASSGVAQILNKPTLATVATSGDYDDLLNTPTIPSASDFVQKVGDTMIGPLNFGDAFLDPTDGTICYGSGTLIKLEEMSLWDPNSGSASAKRWTMEVTRDGMPGFEDIATLDDIAAKMDKQTGDISDDIAVFDGNGNAVDSGVNLTTMVNNFNRYSLTNHVHYSITTEEPGLGGPPVATLEIHNNGTATVAWHPGSAQPPPGEPVPQPWTKVLAFTNDIPSNVSAFNNDAGYVPASTATNIAKQIIRNAVSGVNTNIQSAEDARVALTNLITILKNL